MDERHEPRFIADQPIKVTILGSPETQHAARICNVSGRGLLIEFSSEVAFGAPLKIEVDDAILLGEVVYCRAEDGVYLIGVELDQVLCGLTALDQLLQAFATGEASGNEFAGHIQRHTRA